jgi:hypothetical protein
MNIRLRSSGLAEATEHPESFLQPSGATTVVAGTGAFLPLSVIRELASAAPAQREQFFSALVNQASESTHSPKATAPAMAALDSVATTLQKHSPISRNDATRLDPIEAVIDEHRKQIDRHGGEHGLRDRGLLESALARARNLYAYGQPDLTDLAATLAFGITRNHPFIDGNKRASFSA